jgi:hypothetical protein
MPLPTPLRVEASTCASFPLKDDNLTVENRGGCAFAMHRLAGVDELGTVTGLQSGAFIADIPGQGGICTGTYLATGALRLAISCPKCQFVLVQ